MSFDISTLIRTPAHNPETGQLTGPWLNFYQNIYPAANWAYGNSKAERAYFDGANVYTGTIVLADAAADFDLGTITGDMDDIDDGATYAKILSTSLSSGQALLSQALGDLDDVSDGTGYGKVAKTDISAGHILLSACDGSLDDVDDGSNYGKIAITDISSGHILLASCTGDLDDVAEGTNYGKVAITDISSGHILLSTCTGDLDDVSDGTNYGKVAATDITAGHIILSSCSGDLDDIANGTYGKVLTADISSGHIILSACDGNLDDISDGSSYGKVASTSISAGQITVQGVSSLVSDSLTPSNNLLTNPGFEIAGTSDALGWTQGANILREGPGSNSNYCLNILRSGGSIYVYERYPDDSANRYHEVDGGDTYEFGGMAQSSDGLCTARIILDEYDIDLSGITSTIISSTALSWQAISGIVTLSATTKYIMIRLEAAVSNGNAYFDNLYLRKQDSLSVSWGHSSDVTQIDGGNVYTNTLTATQINGAGFGTLTLTSGSLVINVADGIDIQAGTGLKVRAGADIYVIGSDTDPGLIYFNGTSLNVEMGCANDGSACLIIPSADQSGHLLIGARDTHIPWVTGDDRRFGNISLYADTNVNLWAWLADSYNQNSNLHLSAQSAEIYAYGSNYSVDNDYVRFQLDAANDRFEFYIDGSSTSYTVYNATQFYNTTNKGTDFGLSGQAWDDMYADDYNNEAELYFMDSHDDLGDICAIKGRGEFDPITGLELIDDETLADHMIARHKKDSFVYDNVKDENGKARLIESHRMCDKKLSADGRPWITNRLLFSQIHGALRQINKRLEALEV